jgi:hypothetical protein
VSKPRLLRLLAALAFVAALPAPVLAQALACAGGAAPASEVELFFGRNIGGKLGVTEAKWSRFLAREISPRFPDGLTVIDGSGEWRNPQGSRVVHEPTKVVVILVRDTAQAQQHIDAVVAAYKKRFRQLSVGVVMRPVCASF